jgi:iron complex transport system substrate-binding protein
MRIVSLLPSLTELVCALGRRDSLIGVTHECAYPAGVATLPHLTRSRLPEAATSAEIDGLVSAHAGSIYELDERLLAELAPDLILTQEQCDVCAVNERTVRQAAGRLTGSPAVESVNPTTLDEVWAMFRRVGGLLDATERADLLVTKFQATAREIARRQSAGGIDRPRAARPTVLLLEWLDPPFSCGHWNPDIIRLAGGTDALGASGEKSRRVSWDDIAESAPDAVLVAPCGFSLERCAIEVERVADRLEWIALEAVQRGRVTLVDGSAYFSRPGPRLETSLRIAAAAIDPAGCRDLAPLEGQGWRFLTRGLPA